MRAGRTIQPLSYDLRLPDEVQAAALRLLDVSREIINATVSALWGRLDEFGQRETKYAYKQVVAMMDPPAVHGERQWRCEAEQAGRILRGQAARKQRFTLILPLLEQGMLVPKTEHYRAGKNHTAIKAALVRLRDEDSDGGSAVELQGLIEQACNYYLSNGCFPDTYEQMQAIPVLKVGILPYAADDGGEHGQAYRLRIDLEGGCCYLALRVPDQAGSWPAAWREPQLRLPLPDVVLQRLQAGEQLAPTLREQVLPDGRRYAALDFMLQVPVAAPADLKGVRRVLGWDWGVRTLVTAVVLDLEGHRLSPPLFLDSGGFDGRQARTRRHIDRLKAKVARLQVRLDQFPVGDRRRAPSERQLALLRRETACCWRKYEARNNDLAHLAANVLLLLASVWQAELISGESLKSLKSEGRGRGAKGRWVHWRNNAQIRGSLWRTLRYKCFLAGVHLVWQHPTGTTHTCPRCGKPAYTYASPALETHVEDAGAWLRCMACGWNGARDYAAAINISLLGIVSLVQEAQHTQHTEQTRHAKRPTMQSKPLNSESYTG